MSLSLSLLLPFTLIPTLTLTSTQPHLNSHLGPHPDTDPHPASCQVASWGFFQLLRPILGAIWKADLRPHHALDFTSGWRTRPPDGQRLAHAQLRVCHVKGEGVRVKLSLLPHPHARPRVREPSPRTLPSPSTFTPTVTRSPGPRPPCAAAGT